MELWFYKAENGNPFDKAVAWVTKGPYSHVELYFSNGMCFSSSARQSGTRFHRIPRSNKWEIVDIGHEDKEAEIDKWCETQLYKEYDWKGVFVTLDEVSDDNSKWYCSQIIAYILNKFDIKKIPVSISPNDLYRYIST